MASTLVDRVKIFVLSSGTGAFQLGSASPAYRGTEALVDGASYPYAVENGSNYEVGNGTYLSATNTLVRTPTLSSNSGAAVNFPANVEVSFTVLAENIQPEGSTIVVVQTPGTSTENVMSQKAVTDQLNALSGLITGLQAQIAAITAGTEAFDLPEQTDGDPLPAAGSGLMYTSAGVVKIA